MEDVLIRFRLIGPEAEALRALAAAELRRPRDQVRQILRQELKQRGLLEPTGDEQPERESIGRQAWKGK